MSDHFTKLTGGSCVLAKSKIATMANDYARKNVVPGGVETVVGTWVREYKLVDESKKGKLVEELVEIAEMQSRHEVNSMDRLSYNKLKAETRVEGIIDFATDILSNLVPLKPTPKDDEV